MINNIKQLFCKHIWKEISDELLRTERIREPVGHLAFYRKYSVYAQKSICIKCDKSEVYEHKNYI